MSVLFPNCDATCRGSPCTRERIFQLVLVIEPAIANSLGVTQNFFMVLKELKASPYSYDSCCIDPEVLEAMCAHLPEGTGRASTKKKGKVGARSEEDTWPDVHQEAYLFSRVEWPPDVSFLKDFLSRESEVIYLSDKLFPAPPGCWQFFDANHSIERTLRWPPSVSAKTQKAQPLRNPWKECAPTFTAGSKIVARKWHQISDGPGFLELKRVHPLELMRMNGWDLSFWRDQTSPFSDSVSPELVSDLAGNMWNGWSYMVMEIALAGCCDWSEACRLTSEYRKKKQVQEEKQPNIVEDLFSSDSEGETLRVPLSEMMPWDAQTCSVLKS